MRAEYGGADKLTQYGGADKLNQYGGADELTEDSPAAGWVPLLQSWLADARAAAVAEPNAMVLGTVDAAGHPATRTVLCKGLEPDGIVFFTNYGSDKARHLSGNPYASATFAWPAIGRQVTLRGPTERVRPAEIADYWRIRPRGAQLGAWASAQSRPIGSRAELDRLLDAAAARFGDTEPIPIPEEWGGFRLRPDTVEFWQGQVNRLHNRIRLTRGSAGWSAQRLQP
ncbi:pyridoxamine 5'-phosphate oxidase [Skermania piniformis]|uniref:Pyridoxine/pyridoxamine 5'-phosphate oxidase n=1 Tax=Skermania pinensis TaxID=39122 RepID=A0ABX8SJV7_9ACTN|nr:pyridoxamine 5'-phosphate oxidase [Skermania piniformis]